MGTFVSKAVAGSMPQRNISSKPSHPCPDCSDDEASSSSTTKENVLECPVCSESFNIVENVPYVLWCGHTICKNCIMSLQWDVAKFPKLPIQLPLFISCPWCDLVSLRVVYKDNLIFPRKNYFLLQLIEIMRGEKTRPRPTISDDQQFHRPSGSEIHRTRAGLENANDMRATTTNWNSERNVPSRVSFLSFVILLTAKFPLVIMFILIAVYAVPASAAVVAVFLLVTVLFGLPSFFMLYFAYPSLDWLVKEILT